MWTKLDIVRKDMGVNKHERLSNITLRHISMCFYCCSTFLSVFNNVNNTYPIMSVKSVCFYSNQYVFIQIITFNINF